MTKQPELCRKCGTRLYGKSPLRQDRLCPRHLAEASPPCPPIACSTATIDEGYGWPSECTRGSSTPEQSVHSESAEQASSRRGKDGGREPATVSDVAPSSLGSTTGTGADHKNAEADSSPRVHPKATLAQNPGCNICGDEKILMEPDGSKAQPCYACQPRTTTLEQASRPYVAEQVSTPEQPDAVAKRERERDDAQAAAFDAYCEAHPDLAPPVAFAQWLAEVSAVRSTGPTL